MMRTYVQRQGQDLFLSCFPRLVYGPAFDQAQLEIMNYNNWERLETDGVISTPRRFGKSILTGLLLAICFYYIPNIKIAIFAFSGRQSDKTDGMIGIIRKVLVIMGIKHFKIDNKVNIVYY
ncbi:MAG: hypothetical protein ACHP6H_06480, partial [Legionellales bacterium]